jgi:Flp pilus assembly pilin Flp
MNSGMRWLIRSTVLRCLTRWRNAEDGTELLEYGLLTAAIGLAGLLVFSTFSDRMANAYDEWDSGTQDIWEPCPPLPAVCP